MQSHDDLSGSPKNGSRSASSASHTDASTDLRGQLGEAAEDAKAKAKDEGEHYRDVAADKVDAVADSARTAADQLDDDALGGELSRHITDLADGMSRFSAGLRDKSADKMIGDLRRTARDHPAMFLAGSVALGFGISRFAQASAHSGTRDSPGGAASRGAASRGAASRGAASKEDAVSGAAPQQKQQFRKDAPADAAGTAATGPRDESDLSGSESPLNRSPPTTPRDGHAVATDAADRHPRPPYGAPSIEDERHD